MLTLTQVDSWIWLAEGFVGLLVVIGYAAKETGRNRVAVHDGFTAAAVPPATSPGRFSDRFDRAHSTPTGPGS